MSKTIAKVSPGSHGHTHLEFTDGTTAVVTINHHADHALNNDCHGLKPGDTWPKEAAKETESKESRGRKSRKSN